MSSTSRRTPQPRGHLSRSQAVLCLLLVGLLLYNPFLALIHSYSGLSLHRLPRNRATVGASELQHFSPVTSTLAAELQAVKSIGVEVPVLGEKEFPLAAVDSHSAMMRRDFASNLWFRPPPTA
jgi:hypothetical protein